VFFNPSFSEISKKRILLDFKQEEKRKHPGASAPRGVTFALRVATSVFGGPAKEGAVAARVFAESAVQVFIGFPLNPAFALFRATGETTAGKIVEILFPRRGGQILPNGDLEKLVDDLPANLKTWLAPTLSVLENLRNGNDRMPPVIVLSLPQKKRTPWFLRAETLCGQVPDGTRRVLAFALFAREVPDLPVRVRVLSVPRFLLAAANCSTVALSFCMSPRWTFRFLKKRFGGAASFERPSVPRRA